MKSSSKMASSLGSLKAKKNSSCNLLHFSNTFLYSSQDRSRSSLSESFAPDLNQSSHTLRSSFFEECFHKKPVCLTILEKYFSDVCNSISTKNCVEPNLSEKAESMHEVLKDCLNAIQNLSLEIYVLMASVLKDIKQINDLTDLKSLGVITSKIFQISQAIENGKYLTDPEKTALERKNENKSCEELKNELKIATGRVTARILNLWRKIVYPQKEAGIICSCFLLLYAEIDVTIKVSPFDKIRFDKAVNLFKNYTTNPGYVVTIIRKTQEYIDKNLISVETMKRIHELLGKIDAESVKNIDRSLTAYIIYEMITLSLRYYRAVIKEKYNTDVLTEQNWVSNPKQQPIQSFKTFPSQSINARQSSLSDNDPKKTKFNSNNITNPKFSKSMASGRIEKILNSPEKKTVKNVPPQKSQSPIKTRPISKFQSPIKTKTSYPNAFSAKKEQSITSTIFSKSLNDKPNTVNGPKTRNSLLYTLPASKSNTNILPLPKKLSVQQNNEKSAEFSIKLSQSLDGSKLNFLDKEFVDENKYQKFIEDKFRSFLMQKIKSGEKSINLAEEKIKHEEIALKNKAVWMKEFENNVQVIRNNTIKKLEDDNRFEAELLRAQQIFEHVG